MRKISKMAERASRSSKCTKKLLYGILLFILTTLFLSVCFRLFLDFRAPVSSKYRRDLRCPKSSGSVDAPLVVNFLEENLETLDQNDTRQYTGMRHLTPPSKHAYGFDPESASPTSLALWVDKFFQSKRTGFFIEAGAPTGINNSNTLFLELSLGWTGLLIECNPQLIAQLKSLHRIAWVADGCLSTRKYPTKMNCSVPVKSSHSGSPANLDKEQRVFVDVQAIPLYTFLAALGWKDVDYFSLDLDGQELDMLRNFPFGKARFKVISVKVHLYRRKELRELDTLLATNGYVVTKRLEADCIYVHKGFKKMTQNMQ